MRRAIVKPIVLTLYIAILGLLGTACDEDETWNPTGPHTASYSEVLDRSIDAEDAERLIARTTNGTIDVVGDSDDEVEVEIRKVVRAGSEDEAEDFAALIEVDVDRDGNAISITNDYPRPWSGIEVEVSYTIHCPAELALDMGTVNGSIDIEDSRSEVDATTANGSIDLAGRGGPFQLQASNGAVRADLARLDHAGSFATANGQIRLVVRDGVAPLRLTMANGSAQLNLHREFCGWLDASTTVGRIDNDLRMGGHHGGTVNHAWGEIGEDGCSTPVTVRTAVGNVDLSQI